MKQVSTKQCYKTNVFIATLHNMYNVILFYDSMFQKFYNSNVFLDKLQSRINIILQLNVIHTKNAK